jgi:hypothetical protein
VNHKLVGAARAYAGLSSGSLTLSGALQRARCLIYAVKVKVKVMTCVSISRGLIADRRNVILMFEDIDEFVVSLACFPSLCMVIASNALLAVVLLSEVNAIEGFKESDRIRTDLQCDVR